MASFVGRWNCQFDFQLPDPNPPVIRTGVLVITADSNGTALDGVLEMQGFNGLMHGYYVESTSVWDCELVFGDTGDRHVCRFIISSDGTTFGGESNRLATNYIGSWLATRVMPS